MILWAVKVPSSNKHLIFPSILFTDNQWQEAVFEKCKKRVKAHSREAVGTKLSERHLWLVHQFTSVAKVATISLVSFRQERVTCVSKPKQTRGENAAQTRSKWEFVFFFSKFLVKTLIFGVCFSLRFLSCHTWTFEVSISCCFVLFVLVFEKITRAIFRTLRDLWTWSTSKCRVK